MGQIIATSPGGSSDPRPAQTPSSAEQAAFNRSVAGAVNTINSAGILGENRELTFSVDPATHRPVIRVLDVNTKEVIDQFPAEYVLQLAADTSNRDSG